MQNQDMIRALDKSIQAIHAEAQPLAPHALSVIIPIVDILHWNGCGYTAFKAEQRYTIGEDLSEYEAAVFVRTGRALVIQPACHVYMTVKALDTLMGRA